MPINKYIDPDKITDLITKSKIYHLNISYQNLLDEENGLTKLSYSNNFLNLLYVIIKSLEYEFNIDEDSNITYDLYIKLQKLVEIYDINAVSIDSNLQTSTVTYVIYGNQIGITNFLGLTDTPNSYSGQANKVVAVNNNEDSLVFTTIDLSGYAKLNGGNVFTEDQQINDDLFVLGNIETTDILVTGQIDVAHNVNANNIYAFGDEIVSQGNIAAVNNLSVGNNATIIGNITGANLAGINTGNNAPNTTSNAYADAKVANVITNGVTTIAPAQDVVYDALLAKQDLLDLDSLTLVTPVITTSWTLYKTDGTTPYTPSTSNTKNLVVDKGVKANISSTYQYPVPTTGQTVPTSVSGSYGTTLPAPATSSTVFTNGGTQISANSTYSVTLAKPKSGLIVVGSQVKFPTGNDTTTDSTSISFQGKGSIVYSPLSTLSPTDIQTLLAASPNTAFQTNKARSFSGITAGAGNYTYYIYDASLGAITNIIQNGATPVFTAFTQLSNVTVVNDAGFSLPVIVFKSNATNAFTGVTLLTS